MACRCFGVQPAITGAGILSIKHKGINLSEICIQIEQFYSKNLLTNSRLTDAKSYSYEYILF